MSAAKKGKPAAWLTGPNVGAIKAKLLARAQERPNRKPLASSHSLALTTAGNAKRRRRVLCITDGVVYESVTAASREYGITTAMICWYCSGRYKSRRGLQFRYLDAK
jgi:hypothetical protein